MAVASAVHCVPHSRRRVYQSNTVRLHLEVYHTTPSPVSTLPWPDRALISLTKPSSTPRRGLIHHLRLLFLEALTDPLAASHELLYTPVDAACFALNQGLRRKVVDAAVKAVRYEIRKHAHEFFHLFPLHSRLELLLLGDRESFHDGESQEDSGWRRV